MVHLPFLDVAVGNEDPFELLIQVILKQLVFISSLFLFDLIYLMFSHKFPLLRTVRMIWRCLFLDIY